MWKALGALITFIMYLMFRMNVIPYELKDHSLKISGRNAIKD